jgi:hypothetical protein
VQAYPPRPGPARPRSRRPIRLVRARRPGGGERWLADLDPTDRAAYARDVARLAPAIERRLGSVVVANRVGRIGGPLSVEPWAVARARFRRALPSVPTRRSALVLATDVRDCYCSIRPAALGRVLADLGCDPHDVAGVLQRLERWHADGVRGLPIGPPPSAVLANAALAPADRAIASAGVRHVRWVDDVVMWAGSASDLVRARDRWRRALAAVGLEENTEKVRLLDPRAVGLRASSSRGGIETLR